MGKRAITSCWVAFGLAAIALTATALPLAVINKTAGSRCAGAKCATMMDLARDIFGNNNSLGMYIAAAVAAMILMALASILAGAVGTFSGDRGGLQRMAGGAFGLLAVIFVFGVVL